MLSDGEAQKLPKLSSALLERPQLKLDVPLHTISATDDDALERAALEQALTAAASPQGGAKHAAPRGKAAGTQSPRLIALAALYRQRFQAEPVYPAEAGGAPDAASPDVAKTDAAVTTAAKPAGASQDADAAHIAWLEQELLQQFKPTRDQRESLGRARADAVQAALLANQGLPPERVFLTDRESGGGQDGQVRMELKLQ